MKKNGKRAWAMLLTLALAGSLAACGQKETTQESATPKPTEEAQVSVQPVEIEYRTAPSGGWCTTTWGKRRWSASILMRP